jgi:hypothetical protein
MSLQVRTPTCFLEKTISVIGIGVTLGVKAQGFVYNTACANLTWAGPFNPNHSSAQPSPGPACKPENPLHIKAPALSGGFKCCVKGWGLPCKKYLKNFLEF